VAQAQHAHDEGVAQLVHDLRLPQHLLPHQRLVVVLQDFDGHVDLAPERREEHRTIVLGRTSGVWRPDLMFWRRSGPHDSVIRTPFLTQPKFPEPSSTSSMSSRLLWMWNLLPSLGLWYGLNPSQSMGRSSRSAGDMEDGCENADEHRGANTTNTDVSVSAVKQREKHSSDSVYLCKVLTVFRYVYFASGFTFDVTEYFTYTFLNS